MRRPQDYIFLYLKGIGMGAAEIIPGISGSTLAFISHVYEELIHSLSSLNTENFRMLVNFEFEGFWKRINGTFLIVVLAGIMTSALLLVNIVGSLLGQYPIQVLSFLFGLILLSSLLFLRNIKRWTPGTVLSFLLGTVISYLFTILSPLHTPDNLFFIFLAGVLSACAILLPGISGLFILLLISKYEYTLALLTEPNVPAILIFIAGGVIALIYFSRILSKFLRNYHSFAITLLAGFMFGSLNKTWPWKEIISFRIDSSGNQLPAIYKSILPGGYFERTGKNPDVIQAILFMALGVLIVVLIEKIAARLKTTN